MNSTNTFVNLNSCIHNTSDSNYDYYYIEDAMFLEDTTQAEFEFQVTNSEIGTIKFDIVSSDIPISVS